jgi:hypothetical protein
MGGAPITSGRFATLRTECGLVYGLFSLLCDNMRMDLSFARRRRAINNTPDLAHLLADLAARQVASPTAAIQTSTEEPEKNGDAAKCETEAFVGKSKGKGRKTGSGAFNRGVAETIRGNR